MIVYHQILKATFCITQNTGWDFSLAHYEGGKIPLNWYGLWNMSCFLRLHTPFPSNFKTILQQKQIALCQWYHCATSRSLSRRTQKLQSLARAWKSVHDCRCNAGLSLKLHWCKGGFVSRAIHGPTQTPTAKATSDPGRLTVEWIHVRPARLVCLQCSRLREQEGPNYQKLHSMLSKHYI